MHPKSCANLCADALVQYFLSIYQDPDLGEKQYLYIKHVWDQLWKLPRSIPHFVSELLHANLTHQLPRDVSKPLLFLLMTNLRRIALELTSRQLVTVECPSLFNQSYVLNREYQLLELNVTGVDFWKNINVLVLLLPRLVNLTVLKLGGNTTPEVLNAVKGCPLKMLWISERQAYQPRVPSGILLDIFFGVSNKSDNEVLQAVKKGSILDFTPTWPDLIDLSLGYIHVSLDCLIVLLTLLKKLQHIDCSSISMDHLLWQYDAFKLPSLSLRELVVVAPSAKSAQTLGRVAPNLVKLNVIFRYLSDSDAKNAFQRLSGEFLYLTNLSLSNLRHLCLGEPPLEVFQSLGKGIKILTLQGCVVDSVNLKDVGELLKEFPSLEELKLEFIHGLQCSRTSLPKDHRFPNVTALTIITPSVGEGTFLYAFQIFPNLQEVSILGLTSLSLTDASIFSHIHNLRTLRLSNLNAINVSELIKIPVATLDRRTWNLHMPATYLSQEDIKSIISSGWNFFPKSEYSLLH